MSSIAHTVALASFASVALAFPLSAVAVFVYGVDRTLAAHALSVVFTSGLYLALFAPLLFSSSSAASRAVTVDNKKSTKSIATSPHTKNQKNVVEPTTTTTPLNALVTNWIMCTCSIHVSWELVWILFHDMIRKNANSVLAWPWMSYAATGDRRYAGDKISSLVMTIEVMSVCNGFVGFFALYLQRQAEATTTSSASATSRLSQSPARHNNDSRRFKKVMSLLLLAWVGVQHLITTSIYYLDEGLQGFPNVSNNYFDLIVTFFLVNSPWIVFPWFVLRKVYVDLMAAGI